MPWVAIPMHEAQFRNKLVFRRNKDNYAFYIPTVVRKELKIEANYYCRVNKWSDGNGETDLSHKLFIQFMPRRKDLDCDRRIHRGSFSVPGKTINQYYNKKKAFETFTIPCLIDNGSLIIDLRDLGNGNNGHNKSKGRKK